jgi:hypothetical protein
LIALPDQQKIGLSPISEVEERVVGLEEDNNTLRELNCALQDQNISLKASVEAREIQLKRLYDILSESLYGHTGADTGNT